MIKPSELLRRIWKPDAIERRDPLEDLGRELDRLHGEDDRRRATLRDLLDGLTPKTWTPQLWQNGAQLAITLDFAVYTTIGQLVFVSTRFTVAAAGAVGLVEVRALPFTSLYNSIGGEMVVFTGGVNRIGAARQTAGSSSVVMTIDNNAADFGNAPAVALAIGNDVRMDAVYQRSP